MVLIPTNHLIILNRLITKQVDESCKIRPSLTTLKDGLITQNIHDKTTCI
jgi:hypothetical protein